MSSTLTTVAGMTRNTPAGPRRSRSALARKRAQPGDLVREVGVAALGVLGAVALGHDARRAWPRAARRSSGGLVEALQLARGAHHGRLAHAQVKVGAAARDELAQQAVHVGAGTLVAHARRRYVPAVVRRAAAVAVRVAMRGRVRRAVPVGTAPAARGRAARDDRDLADRGRRESRPAPPRQRPLHRGRRSPA
jgi:hypothetical protein